MRDEDHRQKLVAFAKKVEAAQDRLQDSLDNRDGAIVDAVVYGGVPKREAARLAGVSRSTVYRLLDRRSSEQG